MRRRAWAARGLYLLFLLAVVELSFQAFYRVTTGSFLVNRAALPIFVDDPDSGWATKPGLSFRQHTPEFSVDLFTNSRGFRTSKEHEEYATGRDEARYRILLLGPSFAFGWGVNYEETFAALLPQMLTQRGFGDGRKLELINRGVPALPPDFNLKWLKHVGTAYAPDLVIQFMYGTLEFNPSPSMRVEDGYLVDPNATFFQRATALAKNSAIVFYGWTIVTKMRGSSPPGVVGGKIAGAGREMTPAEAFDPKSPRVTSSMAFYDDLRSTVESHGARLLVVYFPLSFVIHPQDMARWRHLGVMDVATQVAFEKAFAGYLNENGVACLDATEDLVGEARRSSHRMYYWLDIHWTAEGNRVVAQSVATWLAARPEWARHP
jgi:hypothetical protein